MKAATVGDVIDYLLGGPEWRSRECPICVRWPPDAFAIAASILQESGAYVEVVRRWPPGGMEGTKWRDYITEIADEWRKQAVVGKNGGPPPATIKNWWSEIVKAEDVTLEKIRGLKLCETLLQLVAAADEASSGAGVPRARGDKLDPAKLTFKVKTQILLTQYLKRNEASTLCRTINASRAVVLPKMRTPDSGITIRSLTHNLALAPRSGIRPIWSETTLPREDTQPAPDSINLLLIPWPPEILPTQFYPVPTDGKDSPQAKLAKNQGFFAFKPRPTKGFAGVVRKIVEEAIAVAGPIDGIIFPEMALTADEYKVVQIIAQKNKVTFLVSGIYDPPEGGRPGENYACITLANILGGSFVYWQDKHHRWFLDDRQICNYGLGSRLDVGRKWWEYTSLEERTIHFFALRAWLGIAILICEDLARPDPTADILRAVGPNLVISLLQDGPQLSNRWPARSAHPLADDPGCSVLTLTSQGMVNLMRTPPGKTRSRAVAMWRDKGSDTTEIDLPPGAEALVLCLTNRYQEQYTADGRGDGSATGAVGLAGVHPVFVRTPA